jgi:hypothetical protein
VKGALVCKLIELMNKILLNIKINEKIQFSNENDKLEIEFFSVCEVLKLWRGKPMVGR